MKIYFLKRAGRNWWGNLHFLELGNGSLFGHFFFRRKDAKEYAKQYDGEYGNPFEIWSAEVKEDKRDNRETN